jgi:hypothetical protein
MFDIKAFENVKNQIGYCGIWCGSCGGGNGSIQELARRFEDIVKNQNLEKYVPKEFVFKEFLKGLAAIQKMPLCPGCRKSGGPSTCKVRICALDRGVADCSLCEQLARCTKFEQLEITHPKIKGDLIRIRNENRSALVKKWVDELKCKWPHCILFCASARK